MARSFGDMVKQYEKNRYSFSGFLGLSEAADFSDFIKDYDSIPWMLFGGHDGCERVMLRIGSPETLGYDGPFPIALLKISPRSAKFSDELSHRDFLGALLNLGIERDTIGDIYIEDNVGYVFCTESMAPYIIENLERVRHTSVDVQVIDELPVLKSKEPEEKRIQAASLRLDLVIAHTYNMSRGAAQELFAARRVFVNGRLCENNSYELKEKDIVSVRGYGRLKLSKDLGFSRKGKHNLIIEVTK